MRFFKEIKRLCRIAKITRFPIGLSEIQQIIKYYGWEIYSYDEAADIIESYGLKEMTENNDSFAVNIGDTIVIFYDNRISQLDLPHILAHEIGHIVLGHLNNVDDIYAKERDSDCFAEELLSYMPRKIYPIFGFTTIVMIFIGIFGYFSIDRSNGAYNKTSIISATAVDGNPNVVYITKFGNKYHIIGCWHINNRDDLIKISIDEAEHTEHEPCEVCIGE